ncbi:MAG: hypothetical protein NPIRA03_25790 [Nitrospirales bacterium]|nr:MAG: hypothetical protein NPIRA03_25790 [Nitrospirales bacterium]
MNNSDLLFNNVHWFDIDQHQRKLISDELGTIDGNRLLNSSIEDLCDYFEGKYQVNVPVICEDEIVVDQNETQIDVSGDQMRFIHDRSRPFFMEGTAIEVTIPFDGDSEVFKVQPSTYTLNPPRAEVRSQALILNIEGTDLNAEQVRSEIDQTLSKIRSYLDNLKKDAQGLNDQIRQLAKSGIEGRRQKLLANQNLVSSLGFQLKERKDSPKTYVSPEVRRKIVPTMPPASTAPFKPEPILSESDYDHILSVLQNMVQVMERSPSAFASMDEEALRSHFLVQLNGHYEGNATGETFNYEGKTDILIRSEGKNIFIGECKYWNGPKKLTDTLNQLLGYSCWRDTKVAVIIFNRRKDFSKILDAIPETVKAHPNYKRDLGRKAETNFGYVFANPTDKNREMILTVLAFDVPE